MSEWLAPAVVVTIVLSLLGLRHSSRQSKLKADREVLDQVIEDADGFFAKKARFEALVLTSAASGRTSVPALSDAARTLLEAWAALERAAWRVGRLSKLRYDGLRTLGRGIYDACTSTADSRGFLEILASGTALAPATKLADGIPWPDLVTDALVFRTLAVVYRREGPLTPARRVWWRTKGRRESTPLQIGAPLRRRRTARKSEERVTTVEQARTLIREMPALQGLSEAELNAVAYRVLYGTDASDFETSQDGRGSSELSTPVET